LLHTQETCFHGSHDLRLPAHAPASGLWRRKVVRRQHLSVRAARNHCDAFSNLYAHDAMPSVATAQARSAQLMFAKASSRIIMVRTRWELTMSGLEAMPEPNNHAISEAAWEALSSEFEKMGVAFLDLHPVIRSVMARAAISTAHAKQQVENLLRVAAMADRYDLPEDQKQYALVKAYERHAERVAEPPTEVIVQDEAMPQPGMP
jgi:hypothetical protein